MKKIIALLVVTSLFALSSSALCFGTEESSKTAETKILSDVKTTDEKENQEKRNEKIKKFLDEKEKYFPEDKLKEIQTTLMSLNDDKLEKILKVNFYFPDYKSFLYFESGEQKCINTFIGLLSFVFASFELHIAEDIILENITNVATMTIFKICYIAKEMGLLYFLFSTLYSFFKNPCRIKQANFEYFIKLTGEK